VRISKIFPLAIVACGDVWGVTFEEAVVAAYNNNPGWFASQTETRIADEQLTQAKMLYLPDVSGKISSSRKRSDISETGDTNTATAVNARGSVEETGTSMGLSVVQNVFNGFSTVNTIEARENSAKAAHHKLKYEEQNLIVKVLEAYAKIWVGRQKVTAMKKKEENLKKTLDSQNSSLEAGVVTPSDVAQASANHQKAIFERIEAETELFSAESEFEKLTGLKADKDLELPELNIQIPESLDKLIAQALSSDHSIKYYQLLERSAENSLNATRGGLSPRCDLTLQAARSLSKKKYNNSQNDYVASLEVTVPIFSNSQSQGNTYSSIAIANQKALEAKFKAEDAILEVKKNCVVNWNSYLSATAMIKASRSAVKSAELSSASNLEESELGTKSNTDVLVKENQLLESRIDFAKSRGQKLIAVVKLYALTGNLSLSSVLKGK
jgi:TolC family type I secretion outer membrane protein